jgi:hypothetical protein
VSEPSDGPPAFMEVADLLSEPKAREPATLARVGPAFLVEESAQAASAGRERMTKIVERVDLTSEAAAAPDPRKRRVFRLVGRDGAPKDAVTVGRAEGADVALGLSSVSAVHATFRRAGKKWTIEDTGSRNGTFVDGERLGAGMKKTIEPSTVVRFGPEARFTFLDPEGLATYLQSIAALEAAGNDQQDAGGQVRLSNDALGGMALPSYLDDDDDDAPPEDEDD